MFETLEMFDRALLLKINAWHFNWLDELMWVMSHSWHTFVFVLVLAYLFYKNYALKKTMALLLGCALIFACTDLSTNIIKHSVKRYRPTHNLEIKEQVHVVNNYTGGPYGFFSAHAANSFGITTFLFLCLSYMDRKKSILLFVYPIMISYSRVYLGVHYPSDVFVGALSGLLFGISGFYIVNAQFLKLNEQKL